MTLRDRGRRGPVALVSDWEFVALCDRTPVRKLIELAGISRTCVVRRLQRLERDGHLVRGSERFGGRLLDVWSLAPGAAVDGCDHAGKEGLSR